MTQKLQNVSRLLVRAAQADGKKGVFFIPNGRAKEPAEHISYGALLGQATALARVLRGMPNITPETVLLLHLDNHKDSILWLWATVLAGLVPAMSTPFTSHRDGREKHILHLNKMLKSPVVLTSRRLVGEFSSARDVVRLLDIESLQTKARTPDQNVGREAWHKHEEDLFALMLTSGSTGQAKAVELRHGQVLAALAGKAAYNATTQADVFLNWIGLDHVANLTEIHLHAMFVGAHQVQVQAVDVLTEPLTFLQLTERYGVSYTFAPNFFLASVKKSVDAVLAAADGAGAGAGAGVLPNLSTLRVLQSGGEANGAALAECFTATMRALGAPQHFLRPGFGMTETCAGCVYATECPTFDRQHGREFASLGRCMPGMSMRITGAGGAVLGANQDGNVQVRGGNVFAGYFNNAEATAAAFTADGWFMTGDLGCIDEAGNLHMTGRAKETIIINGLKYFPHEMEAAIEAADLPGVTPSFTAVFPHRPPGAASETVCVVYLATYAADDVSARFDTCTAIGNVIMKHCMARPHRVMPLDHTSLPKTALGKLSRARLRQAFESGQFQDEIRRDEACMAQYMACQGPKTDWPTGPVELAIQAVVGRVLGVPPAELSLQANVFDMGCSSVDLFSLQRQLQAAAPTLPSRIPVSVIISNPTIGALGKALASLLAPPAPKSPSTYSPVVTLRSRGSKPPLWLVHPGIGEVLVFLHLARHLEDRPVYALRARGFDGEPFFGSIDDMATTYLAHVRRVQPSGPYALAGYSYGGTVAFEMAKKLPADEDLGFLAVFDLPPNIQHRLRRNTWVDVLLILAKFFALLPDDSEAASARLAARLKACEVDAETGRDRAVELLLAAADRARLHEFGLDKDRLATWTSLALNSHTIARAYEPHGRVSRLDVLYAHPRSWEAATMEEWQTMLRKWALFVQDVRFHEVSGHHYTLIARENAESFARKLEESLAARGM